MDLMTAIREGEYEPDSLTIQPIRNAIQNYESAVKGDEE
jgi:hypothetical protein